MGEIVFLVSDQAKRTVALVSREDIRSEAGSKGAGKRW